MSKCPQALRYSKSHEWVRIDNDVEVTIGVTDHAQTLLGELVFVELPELNLQLSSGDAAAVLESVKTAADVYCPVAGKIIAVNAELQDDPSYVNQDPYGKGWLFKVSIDDPQQLNQLLSADAYQAMIEDEDD